MPRSRKGRSGQLETIGKLIGKVYPTHEPDEARALRVFAAYARAVPDRILRNARPVQYQRAVLTVHTATAAWANALSLESTQLLGKLRFRVPDVPLSRIAFRVGKLPDMIETVRQEPPPPRLLPLAQLPDELARELARIHHDGLRERVARAIAVSLGGSEPRTRDDRRGSRGR
jgi:hypothetical protein